MPKIHNTNKQRRDDLYKRITPDHLFNSTSVFSNLSKRDLDEVKKQYTLYFRSWVEDDARKFILGYN